MNEKVEYYDNCHLKIYSSPLYKIFILRGIAPTGYTTTPIPLAGLPTWCNLTTDSFLQYCSGCNCMPWQIKGNITAMLPFIFYIILYRSRIILTLSL